jgi:hypothetical protein
VFGQSFLTTYVPADLLICGGSESEKKVLSFLLAQMEA